MRSLAVLLLFGLASCASILSQNNPYDETWVRTSPPGATLWLDGDLVGTTPALIRFPQKGVSSIRVEFDGYEPVAMPIPMKANMAFWLNLVSFGPIGMIGDATAGYYEVAEPVTYVVLTPVAN